VTLTVERVALAPDLSISRVLTGLWQIADMERDGRALDSESAARSLRSYVDAGFTSFDMADHYGSAEIVASHLRDASSPAGPVQLFTKWVPKPGPLTLAAAAIAGADGVLAAGGAHAIAALAFGAGPLPACDVVVGPGNRYVAAAKQLVGAQVATDTIAGPSGLVVFADATASPGAIAADLLAQAEHDPDAVPVLVTLDPRLADRVEAEIARQLGALPTAAVAREALANGGVVTVASVEEGIAACDALAPEHVELFLQCADVIAPRLAHFGALFIGGASAEVLGDYGAGPNHVLPTGGTARSRSGLSVYTFLRVRTWLRIDDGAAARPLVEDAAWFGRVEGLEGHARAAEARLD